MTCSLPLAPQAILSPCLRTENSSGLILRPALLVASHCGSWLLCVQCWRRFMIRCLDSCGEKWGSLASAMVTSNALLLFRRDVSHREMRKMAVVFRLETALCAGGITAFLPLRCLFSQRTSRAFHKGSRDGQNAGEALEGFVFSPVLLVKGVSYALRG
jgi:hypothetical protein